MVTAQQTPRAGGRRSPAAVTPVPDELRQRSSQRSREAISRSERQRHGSRRAADRRGQAGMRTTSSARASPALAAQPGGRMGGSRDRRGRRCGLGPSAGVADPTRAETRTPILFQGRCGRRALGRRVSDRSDRVRSGRGAHRASTRLIGWDTGGESLGPVAVGWPRLERGMSLVREGTSFEGLNPPIRCEYKEIGERGKGAARSSPDGRAVHDLRPHRSEHRRSPRSVDPGRDASKRGTAGGRTAVSA